MILKTQPKKVNEHLEKDHKRLFILRRHEFINELRSKYPLLDKQLFEMDKLRTLECRMILMMRDNLQDKEIADLLELTKSSLRVAKYRLRQKLGLKGDQDLLEYFVNNDNSVVEK